MNIMVGGDRIPAVRIPGDAGFRFDRHWQPIAARRHVSCLVTMTDQALELIRDFFWNIGNAANLKSNTPLKTTGA